MATDLGRVKRNVGKMVAQSAPETDIDAYIASEGTTVDEVRAYQRPDQSYAQGLLRTGIGQGTLFGLGDEAMGLLRSIGEETYDDALKDERAKVEAFRSENPGTALAAELAGGFVTPGLGIAGGVLKAGANASRLSKIGRGAGVGAGFGGAYGFASSEGGEGDLLEQAANRLPSAGRGALFGAGLGAALPTVSGVIGGAYRKVRDFAAPAIARHTKGVEGAADQVMSQRMREAGDTPQGFRQQLTDAEEAARFYSNSRSPVPMALVDQSEAMRKLAGSAARSSDEAGQRAETFFRARQTGVTPKSASEAQMVDEAGLTTRNPFSMRADEAPAGQYERIRDALHRTLTIKDKDFHEFGKNAYATEKNLMGALRSKAQTMFPAAYKEAQPFDISSAVAALDDKLADRAGSHAATLAKAKKLFTDPKSPNGAPLGSPDHLKRFQSAKEMLDDMIEVAMRQGKGKLAGDLSEFRRNATAAVKAANPKYEAALDYYSSRMELKDAIDAGRNAFKEGADVTADQFRDLSEGQKKLFRLGLLESYETQLGRGARANDRSRIFEQPNVQELLSVVIPRTETATGRAKKGAVFANRPERFGDFITNEKRMVESGREVMGGSQTAERLQADAKFTRQSLGQMVDALRSSGGAIGVVMEATAAGLNKIFGMREDVAAEIGRRLLTARPEERERVLQRLEQLHPQGMSAFYEFLSGLRAASGAALSGQAGQEMAEPAPLAGSTPYRRRFDDAGNPTAR